ncbi:hypothetical protein PCANC_03580 [Puccinia coronata f. sp. avenae]|uniref:Vacuolar protein-sorting-associated protein 36 n=1 Tax=Puccinia coronata f. sp. avenae TaxID=200324 RepID=A0A2N5VV34_9BASI|nr:hypothetical protein PCANC_03580 [Puccinia coronata f. sp. avenae]
MNQLRLIDTTNQTLSAQLFFNEEIIQAQTGIGIYDGKNKDDRYQDGTLYLTSHRLVYVDRVDPHRRSCFLDLSLIRQTEYWIGFLKSSPKITLLLGTRRSSCLTQDPSGIDHKLKLTSSSSSSSSPDLRNILTHPAASHWTCHVCAFSNPPELKCGLCGIPRDLSATTTKSTSNSRPPSSFNDYSSSLSGHPNPTRSHTRSLSNLRGTLNHVEAMETASGPAPHIQRIEDAATSKEISCPSCTFLNHPSMARCEICDSILGRIQMESLTLDGSPSGSNHNTRDSSELQHSRAATPAPPSSFPEDSYIRLSFRKGGDKSFYFSLKKALQGKSWNTTGLKHHLEFIHQSSSSRPSEQHPTNNIPSNTHHQKPLAGPIGIDRILKTMDSQQQAHHAELTEGLQDLQALMAKAKEMVQLSQSINAKLTSLESQPKSSEEGDSADQKAGLVIRSSLVKLGLPAPAVTADMMSHDQAFARELAKELAGVLARIMAPGDSGLMTHACLDLARGIRPLDEVWCIWNRARGISLVSPADMISACAHLPEYTSPEIRLRTFKSGLRVLHTPDFSAAAFEARLVGKLRSAIPEEESHDSQQHERGDDGEGLQQQQQSPMMARISTLEIAQAERLSVSLTGELIQSIELAPSPPDPRDPSSLRPSRAAIVRDFDPQTGLTFWLENLISEYRWVDPNFP